MKFVFTVVSSLAIGLMMAANEFAPIVELHRLLVHKRRVLISFVLATGAFFLILAGFVVAVIEAVTQYEVQGFVLWSALFSAALIFAVTAALLTLVAKLVLPKPAPPTFNWAAIDKQFKLSEMLEQWTKQGVPTAAASPAPAATTSEATAEFIRAPGDFTNMQSNRDQLAH